MSELTYETVSKETLESLSEKFDEILDDVSDIPEADLALSVSNLIPCLYASFPLYPEAASYCSKE